MSVPPSGLRFAVFCSRHAAWAVIITKLHQLPQHNPRAFYRWHLSARLHVRHSARQSSVKYTWPKTGPCRLECRWPDRPSPQNESDCAHSCKRHLILSCSAVGQIKSVLTKLRYVTEAWCRNRWCAGEMFWPALLAWDGASASLGTTRRRCASARGSSSPLACTTSTDILLSICGAALACSLP